MHKNYYELLGVQRNALDSDIKKAYRKLALKFHPDHNPGDDFFAKRFNDIQEAYNILSNPDSRRRYDLQQKGSQNFYGSRNYAGDNTNSFDQIITEVTKIHSTYEKPMRSVDVTYSEISKYLNKYLSPEMIKVAKVQRIRMKAAYTLALLPLLRFSVFTTKEREEFFRKLLEICSSHEKLTEKLHQSYLSQLQAQKARERKPSFFENNIIWIMGAAIALMALLAFLRGDLSSSNSRKRSNPEEVTQEEDNRNVVRPYERISKYTPPEAREVERNDPVDIKPRKMATVKLSSKWIGHQLHTGDSPYNAYFGSGIYDADFENIVVIKNGHETDVIACLSEISRPYRTIRNEYVRAGDSFEMTNIPNGTYYIKYFSGNDWNPDTTVVGEVKGFFETSVSFSQSKNENDLIELKQDDQKYSIVELTLYPVTDGNMESEEIDATGFFKK